MAETTQSYANHARYYPLWHFIAFPILAGNVGVAGMNAFREPSFDTGWQLLVAIALVLTVYTARVMSLTLQDRVIRDEERIRLARILPDDLRGAIDGLTVPQLVGLRFASDGEVADLVRRIVAGELTEQKAIKQAVATWRSDTLRV